MTLEEIQQIIEPMLTVPHDLQQSQLRQQEELDRLLQMSEQLVGYSIHNESDHLNLEEPMNRLEQRIRRLEAE